MYSSDSEYFIANIDVAVSGQFFGWVMALGSGVKIISPEKVVNKMKQRIEKIGQLYR